MPDKRPEQTDLEKLDFGGLENSSGFLITLSQVLVFQQFKKALSDQGIQPGQISALILIHHNPGINHGALAEAIRFKPAHLTKLIKSLDMQGLVRRSTGRTDRRVAELHLTRKGRNFVEEKAAIMFAHDAARPDGLTPEEKQEFIRLLRKFLRFCPDDAEIAEKSG